MQIQDKIEQTAKEYLKYKDLYDSKSKDFEEIKKNLKPKEDEESLYSEIFDKIGSVELLKIDMNQTKIKLYHQIKLVEDLLEIPKEIVDLVSDYNPVFIFTKEGDIVNQDIYNKYKENYIKESKFFNKINKNV